ncbi:MAG: hypothetical protein QNJ98_10580 [Planctomycetota bacterium]|nr:hypothetical protein [Planctomycetota bacterium]
MTTLRLPLLILLIALLTGPAVADDTPASDRFRSHDLRGYAFEADLPTSWRLIGADSMGVTLASSPRRSKGHRFEVALYTKKLTAKTLEHYEYDPETMSLEELDQKISANNAWYSDQKTFHEGRRTIGGLSMYERHIGPATYKNAEGTTIEAKAGVARLYSVITSDLVRINLRVNAYRDQRNAEMPLLSYKAYDHEVLLRSLTIRKTSELTPKQKQALPTVLETDWVRISQRRDYTMDLDATIFVPAGFKAAIVVDDQANKNRERGTFAVQITPPTPEGRKQPLGIATLILEGLPVQPQVKANYLATLDARVKGVMPNGKLISTTEMRHFGLWQLESRATRRGSSTGATVVRTYVEKREGGQSIVLKAWTAGGMTGAAHMILMGDSKDFDALESAFAPVIELLVVLIG